MTEENKKKSWKEIQRERQMKQQHAREENKKQNEQKIKRKQKPTKKTIIFAVCLATILITASAYGVWQYYEGQKPPTIEGSGKVVPSANVNAPAPDFSLTDINGTRVSLSQFKGKVIGIHFMAVGCHGQIYQINSYMLNQLYSLCNSYCGKDSIALFTVAVATCENSQLDQLRESYGVNWILGNDYEDGVLDVLSAFSSYDIYDGSVVLIDKAFNIAQIYTMGLSNETLTSIVSQML
ncbi:MAG: hypothetical protein NWE94_10200 [Candidatus Bathyarchaeota archaeon]|nr:hypothetical protein [Candidatus Bathyarchaeota archaeon]